MTTAGWVKNRILGRGSYGIVYQGIPIHGFGDYTAIKCAPVEDSWTLQKEKKILLDLGSSCPYLVRYIQDGFTEDYGDQTYNLVLEYANIGTLLDVIKSGIGGKLGLDRARRYTRMILTGLCFLHDKGYVHSDLKPANILAFTDTNDIAGSYVLKISDFGLCKKVGKNDRTTDFDAINESHRVRFFGTPLYMSPESIRFGEQKQPLDIWSLGCTVIEMLTGIPPYSQEFDCLRQFASAVGVYGEKPKFPEGISASAKDFLDKCFEIDPRKRWTAQMLLDHDFVIVGIPLSVRPAHDQGLWAATSSSRNLPTWSWVKNVQATS